MAAFTKSWRRESAAVYPIASTSSRASTMRDCRPNNESKIATRSTVRGPQQKITI
jgi:hypothetical protein